MVKKEGERLDMLNWRNNFVKGKIERERDQITEQKLCYGNWKALNFNRKHLRM